MISESVDAHEIHDSNNNESLIFESQDEDESVQSIQNKTDTNKVEENKTKRNKFNWGTHSHWQSLDEVEEFLNSEGFVIHDDKDLKCGQKFYFRCMRIPKDRKREEWCSKRFIVFLPSHSNEIILQTNFEEHNHNELLKGKKRSISIEMLEFIHDLYKRETKKASSILLHIDGARKNQGLFVDEPNPSNRQLEYCLRKYNLRDTGKMVSLGDVMKWCESNSSYPKNGDEAFVLSYECNTDKAQKGFHFCITTPNLLGRLSKVSIICIDATYKLNWMGFPLVILGTVDKMKRFHPMIYACTSHEATQDYIFVFESVKVGIATHFPQQEFAPRTLIADGAD